VHEHEYDVTGFSLIALEGARNMQANVWWGGALVNGTERVVGLLLQLLEVH
jgi:hypothetical protein